MDILEPIEGREALPPKPYLAGRRHRAELKEKSNKRAETLKPATLEPRNNIEALFLQRYGTITPVPEATHRRKQSYISAAVLYIHHNKTIKDCSEACAVPVERLMEIKKEDGWDHFRQQLQQVAQPSALALIEYHDIELIEEERKRRLGTVETLREQERKLLLAVGNMLPGSLQQATALASIEKIRKIIGNSIGLEYHASEQSHGRKTAITKMIADVPPPDQKPMPGKGTILDV